MHRIRTCKPFTANDFQDRSLTARTHSILKVVYRCRAYHIYCVSVKTVRTRSFLPSCSYCWRRWRDSNSRASHPAYFLSREASSTSLSTSSFFLQEMYPSIPSTSITTISLQTDRPSPNYIRPAAFYIQHQNYTAT